MDRRLNIRPLRNALGMSQRDLAQQLGVTPAAVGYWETGARKPGMDNLLAMAELFHCSIDDLFGREPPERTSA